MLKNITQQESTKVYITWKIQKEFKEHPFSGLSILGNYLIRNVRKHIINKVYIFCLKIFNEINEIQLKNSNCKTRKMLYYHKKDFD